MHLEVNKNINIVIKIARIRRKTRSWLFFIESEAQFLVAQNDLNAVWISGKTGDESLAADAVRAETVCTDTGLSTGSLGSHAECIWRTGHGVDA